jgi:hypothetical protein
MKYNFITSLLIFILSLLNPLQAWDGEQLLPPTKELEKIIFQSAAVNNGILRYKAATAPSDPISWTITRGQAAYLMIVVPAGINKLVMSINSTSLAGSQSVMFRDYGEMDCPEITESPKIESPKISEIKQPEWEVLTGARSVIHLRDEASPFFQSGSCVFFGFANLDNLNGNGIQLEDVLLTYTISDISKFENWVKGDLSLSITKPVNGKVTIDQKDCPTECTHTYPADTEVTLTAKANDGYVFDGWSDDCEKGQIVENSTTIKMDSNKTCSAIFILPPITLKIDPPSNGIIINYNNEKHLKDFFNKDKNILCTKELQNCSAEFTQNQKVILLTVPLPGYKLQNWGTETIDAYGNSNTSYIKIIPIEKNDNNLIEIPTAEFISLD